MIIVTALVDIFTPTAELLSAYLTCLLPNTHIFIYSGCAVYEKFNVCSAAIIFVIQYRYGIFRCSAP